jgi:hypothetical protein
MSRSIHLFRPEWNNDPDPEILYEYVVESLLHGPRYIQVALELWRLADDEERAAKIKAVLRRGCERNAPILYTEDIKEFYELLDGLDDALKASLLDENWNIPPERLDEVRRRTREIDLGERPQHRAVKGVEEGLSEVHGLRDFLKQALDQNLHVALD